MTINKTCCLIVLLDVTTIFAQHPFHHWTDAIDVRYDSRQPLINYLLTVDSTDTSGYQVDMHIQNVSDSFEVAMVAHPEYDDRYWRYVKDLRVESKTGNANISRQDSSLWKVIAHGGDVLLHYRIQPPLSSDAFRSAWKAFLTSTGGLVGGPHSFMYVVGASLTPSYITLKIPSSWQAVTGLQSTSQPNRYFAPSVFVLVDDPIFIGQFKSWSFDVSNVPHRVIYWPLSAAKNFDTTRFVEGIQKLVEQASLLFGRLPYREYFFMLQDGAGGALEHNNSVTVGAPASTLARDLTSTLSEIAHEYFHTWNLMRIHPVEYEDVDYKTPHLSKGLWFSEGLTMFYADILMRRSHLPVSDSTRRRHLETLIRRYLSTSAYAKYSAEDVSRAAYGPVGMLGDYTGSTHLQGETLGAMLDLIIRDATDGKHSMDDVMRKMMEKFSGEKGFTSKDIETTTRTVCHCDVHQFFVDYVFGKTQINFNKYLELIGLQVTAEWKNALSADGKIAPDVRVYSWQPIHESNIRLGISNPANCWTRAGLHTGDILRSVNGTVIKSSMDFRTILRQVKFGDTLVVEVQRPQENFKTTVVIDGYQQPEIHLVELTHPSAKQKRLFAQWANAD